MQQFVVQKVNRMGEEAWTTRVLTIDPVNHILYLSQRGNVSSIEHHCMVKIKEVNWWPHYNGFLHSTAYFLGESPLSFSVEGSTTNNGETSPLSRVFHLRTRPIKPAEREALERSYASLNRDAAVSAAQIPTHVYCRDEWVLRCMSRKDVDPLLAALRGAVVDPSCVKGTIRAAPENATPVAEGYSGNNNGGGADNTAAVTPQNGEQPTRGVPSTEAFKQTTVQTSY